MIWHFINNSIEHMNIVVVNIARWKALIKYEVFFKKENSISPTGNENGFNL